MIISRTPFRVSLFGGGSDYPQWYEKNGGAVLGFAIKKYCYISLRPLPPFFEYKHRIVYSKVEMVNTIADIQHPAVRHVLSDMKIDYGVEIHHDGDLPARSGLGSSSSFTVGLINALHAQAGRMTSKDQLAREAIRMEQHVIKENVGSQDQVWAAYGGMNRIDFKTDGSFTVTDLILDKARRDALLGRLVLCFTGFSRLAHEMAGKQIANMKGRDSHFRTMQSMVDEAEATLRNPGRPLSDIGNLLREGWRLKREIANGVSSGEIDEIYQAGLNAGAIGGKLLGAGGGGFILFYVEPDKQTALRERLSKLITLTVDVDHAGSRIVVYEPDES